MPEANKTPCRSVPAATTKEELKELHRAKMKLKKAAIKHEYDTRGSKRVFRVTANLSKKHEKHGKHPKEAY